MKKNIIIILCFLFGLGIFLFPIISNYLNSIVHYTVIEDYQDNIKEIDEDELGKMREEAEAHNRTLTEQVTAMNDPFSKDNENERKISEYATIINVGQAMGYIDIPVIDVELPIYSGVSDSVLSQGIGHLPRSSLPIGGKGTHASLTGHRGLPTSKLFRNLGEVEIGDQFFIHTLDNTLAYQVDQIKIVLPHELEELAILPDEDYVTLITCEPYMINTHRLLVRGTRIPFEPDAEAIDYQSGDILKAKDGNRRILIGSILIGVLIIGTTLGITLKVLKKREEKGNGI
ncbi:class C sortase [Amphibacillus indicireducens]|uniref:Class C sortase n=1 Tax=Amphibacillus indicireducens TaxID=1076330 RepID=A0ABP7W0P0_9BACI